MLMQLTIQTQKGFPNDMTCRTEFRRPLTKIKRGVAFGHAQDTKGRRDALAFYGDATRRFENYAPDDLAFVAAALGDFAPFRYFRYDRGVS